MGHANTDSGWDGVFPEEYFPGDPITPRDCRLIVPSHLANYADQDPGTYRIAKNKFIIRMAQALCDPYGGSLSGLADFANVPRSTLVECYATGHGVISPAVAVKLNRFAREGNMNKIDVLPLHFIRPDIFKA